MTDGLWRTVKFGDVVRPTKEKVDPETSGLERYVAGEHMDSNELQITRWGTIGDGYLGPAFHRRFRAGQVLYGSRRTYLRKVALADFDGVCANTTFVCETKNPDVLLPELLPFVMQTETFHGHSVAQSKGSVNPYINWPDLAWYEFDLPPIDEQREIAELLWGAERGCRARLALAGSLQRSEHIYREHFLASHANEVVVLDELVDQSRPICYGILKPGLEFDGGVRVVDVKDYPEGVIQLSGVRRADPKIESKFHRSRLHAGDLLMSIRGTIGRVVEVPVELDGGNISRDSARISLKDGVNRAFVRTVLESDFVQRQVRTTTTGLAVKGINIGRLRQVAIPMSSHDDQRRFVANLTSIGQARERNQEALRASREVRSAILRMLAAA